VSEILEKIRSLVASGNYAFSNHAYEELDDDGIFSREITEGLTSARVVEDYPDAKRGPTVLVLCKGDNGSPIHAVWGIHASNADKAVLVTAYRPKSNLWTSDWLRRL
jgi:Domain of unknown function (DUF4258)